MKDIIKFLKKNQKVLLCVLAVVIFVYFVLPKINEKFQSGSAAPEPANSKKLVFNLVNWCGHCTKLKQSGEIEKLKKEHPEIKVEENNDDDAKNDEYGCTGFPCIKLADGVSGALKPYQGPRTAEGFANFYRNN